MTRQGVKRTARGTTSLVPAKTPRGRRPGATARGEAEGGAPRAPGRGKYDRTRTADERARDQRRRLLDAAGHVFAEVGWAEATVEAIVTRAGMSRRTFYEHFDDLKDCLATLHVRVVEVAFRAVEAAVARETEPTDQLRVGVTTFLGGIAAFPHMARVLFRVVRAAGPEFEELYDRSIEQFLRFVFDGIQRAYELGRVGRPADEIRIFALVSAIEAVAMRFVIRGEEAKALDAAPILIDMVQRTFA